MTTVYDSMRAALSTVDIYDTSAPNLSAELHAYADELERLYSELDELLDERWLATAGDMGLSEYEELFGPARHGEDADERRRLLSLRLTLGCGDFTPGGIRQALDSFGLEYEISEYPGYDRLNITAQSDYTKAQQNFIKAETAKIIPAHIEYQLVFNTLTWNDHDAMNRSWSAIDGDNLKWAQIDELTPSV